MNKEYYIPEIEDLFVGYECEKLIVLTEETDKNVYKSNWVSHTITSVDFSNIDTPSYEAMVFRLINVRTPYLTKEQIEKEGWEVTNEGVDSCGNEIFFKEYKNKLNIFNVKYYLEFTHCNGNFGIRLYMQKSLFDDSVISHLYCGNCPSINEFKKICKLLEI